MNGHAHEHRPAADPVSAGETARLKLEARRDGATPVGYFLGKAADAQTQRERTYWLGRVDSARYFAARAASREKLSESARRNMEAAQRLERTECSLRVARVVGTACVLHLVPGDREPDSYALTRREAGESGTTGYGHPVTSGSVQMWVVQSLKMNTVHQFAVVSELDSGHEVTGPWLSVPIGNVSTEEIQERERAEARRAYHEREADEARRAREHSERRAQERRERAEALRRQEDEARKQREEFERERIRKEKAHEKAVAELPLVAPRDLTIEVRDRGSAGVVLDISFLRGTKPCRLFQFKVGGTVLGYPPDGRYSGRKPANHRYHRTVPVQRGRTVQVQVYAVTEHGNAGEPVDVEVPYAPELSRAEQIEAAVRTYRGRRTLTGKPWLRYLRRHAGMPRITRRERDDAHRKVGR